MWHFRFLVGIIMLHTCFRHYGLLQETRFASTFSFYSEDYFDRDLDLFK